MILSVFEHLQENQSWMRACGKEHAYANAESCRGQAQERKKIEEYIRNQLEEDGMGEQLTMGNF